MKSIFTKIKDGFLIAWGVIATLAVSVFAIIFATKNNKEKKELKRKVKKHEKYSEVKNEIDNETEQKIDSLNADDSDSFNSSLELLHDAREESRADR